MRICVLGAASQCSLLVRMGNSNIFGWHFFRCCWFLFYYVHSDNNLFRMSIKLAWGENENKLLIARSVSAEIFNEC